MMIDPVFTEDGETYDREAIEAWLTQHDTSPNTNKKLDHKNLTANRHLKSQISEFVERNKMFFEKELLEATKQGKLDTVKFIFRLGIRIDTVDENHWTPLHHAAYENHLPIATFLLDNKCNINQSAAIFEFHYENKVQNLRVLNESRMRMLSLAPQLEQLRQELASTDVKIRRSENKEATRQEERKARSEYDEYVKYLSQGHAQMPNGNLSFWEFREGTVLHNYCQSEAEVRFLRELQETFVKKNRELVDLHECLHLDESRIESLKLRKAQLTELISASQTETDKHQAIIEERSKQHLIDVNRFAQYNRSQCTPLLLASFKGNIDIMRLLLNRNAQLLKQDKTQATLLHWAALGGQSSSLRLLFTYDNDHLAKDVGGNTPLDIAHAFGSTDCVEFLQEVRHQQSPPMLAKRLQALEEELKQLRAEVQHLKALQPQSAQQPISIVPPHRDNESQLSSHSNITFLGQLAQTEPSSEQASTKHLETDDTSNPFLK